MLHYKVVEKVRKGLGIKDLFGGQGDWEHTVSLSARLVAGKWLGSSSGFLSMEWKCGGEQGQGEQ